MIVDKGKIVLVYEEDIKNGEFNSWEGITCIGEDSFKWLKKLKKITIPSTIKSIEENAFEECINLKEVIIEDGVEKIDSRAFCDCEKLEHVRLPNTIEEIKNGTFENCINLKKIDIPDNVLNIGKRAFYSCSALDEVKLPSKLEKIDTLAFGCCSALSFISIPHSVKEIGEVAFTECSLLRSVELNEGIEKINDYAFSFCYNLNNIKIPNSIKILEEGVFTECRLLSDITFSKNLESIRSFCFSKCDSLEEVTLPEKMKLLGDYVFDNCKNLKRINLLSDIESIGDSIFFDCSLMREVVKKGERCDIEDYKNVLLFSNDMSAYEVNNLQCSSVMSLILFVDKKRIMNSKIKYPDSFLNLLTKERLQDIFEHDSNKHFKEIYINYEQEFLKAHNSDALSFYKFAYYLGCFSNEEASIGGKKVNVAQKACVYLKSLLDSNVLRINECYSLFRTLQVQQNNVNFLKYVSESSSNFIYLLSTGDSLCKIMEDFDKIINEQLIVDSKGRTIKNPSVKIRIQNYLLNVIYDDVKEGNEDIVEEFSKYVAIKQENFLGAQQIRERGKKTPSHIIGKELKEKPILERIEEIQKQINKISLRSKKEIEKLYEKEFTYEWLDKHDPKNFTLGLYCDCCASILSYCYGFNIMEESIIKDNCQNLVIKDKKGDIIAKATIYVNKKKGYAVFNDIEINNIYGNEVDEDELSDDKERKKIYMAFKRGVNDFVGEYNKNNKVHITQVNVGWGSNKLKQVIKKIETKSEELLGTLSCFKDAQKEQWIVYKKGYKNRKS